MQNRPRGLRRKPHLPAAFVLAVLIPLASPSRAAEIDFELRAISRTDPSLPNTTAAFDSGLGVLRYALSNDGRYVAFVAWSPNLLPGFSMGGANVFLFDNIEGDLTPISHRHDDPTIGGNHYSEYSAISGDGGTIAFGSRATDLILGYSGTGRQVYAADLTSGTLRLVSASWNDPGAGALGFSTPLALSENGRYLYFSSGASNLVPGYEGAGDQIYLADLQAQEVRLVTSSWKSPTTGGAGFVWDLSASSDGSLLAFAARDANLVEGDPGAAYHVYLFDRDADAIRLVSGSIEPGTTFSNGSSYQPEVSLSGSHVAFASTSTDLLPDIEVAGAQVYVYRVVDSTLELTSTAEGQPNSGGNGGSYRPRLSQDGRWIAFASRATDLLELTGPADESQTLLFDRQAGQRLLASHTPFDATNRAHGGSEPSAITADGFRVLFDSSALDLIDPPWTYWPGYQVYSFERVSGDVRLHSHVVGVEANSQEDNATLHSLSGDGRIATFQSASNDLSPGDWNRGSDVFRVDLESGDLALVSKRHPSLPISRTGNGMSFFVPEAGVSEDGRFTVFESYAWNLAPDLPDPGDPRPFLYDAEDDVVVPIGASLDGWSADLANRFSLESEAFGIDHHFSDRRRMSADAGIVCFGAFPPIPGTSYQSFAFDRRTGEDRLLSHRWDSPTTPGNDHSSPALVSANGRTAILWSHATDLIQGYTGTGLQVYHVDLLTGLVQLVTRAHYSATTGSLGQSSPAGVSFDGRWVAFSSDSSDLLAGYSGIYQQAYIFDALTGAVQLASRSANDPQQGSNGGGSAISMSQDGRFLAFRSTGQDILDSPDPTQFSQILLWDRISQTATLVSRSISTPTTFANGQSDGAKISRDGRFVAFRSQATDLISGYEGSDDVGQIYRFNRITGGIDLVSHAVGKPSQGALVGAEGHSISADGQRIALISASRDIADNSPHSGYNFYLYDSPTDHFTLLTQLRFANPDTPIGSFPGAQVSADGRSVAFDDQRNDLVDRDWNFLWDSWDAFVAIESHPSLVFRDGFGSGDATRWSEVASGE